MVFSSPVFLFLFLPVCFACMVAAAFVDKNRGWGRAAQNVALVLFSLAFFLYGSGGQILILVGSIAVSHVCGIVIGGTRFKKTGLAVSVVLQLAVLGYFKYANFFVDQANAVRSLLSLPVWSWERVLLPAGISFFVFHAISYTIDIYRGVAKPLRSPLDTALYISMFPQLIAGPIVRFGQIADQLRTRTVSVDDLALGGSRFVYGLLKKVAVADSVGDVADAAFAVPLVQVDSATALIGAFAYTFQIYFDFSAYSDMAIGLARMFGFRFPENFARPLTASSITDFWRRWHMTLSFWFRDYVYKPLGGSRGKKLRTYFNLWSVFLLSGLWHGATWTFVVWGAYHGTLLTIERALGLRTDRAPVWRRALTFLLVVIGFTIFRSGSFEQALVFYRHMFVPDHFNISVDLLAHLNKKNTAFLVVAAASLLLPADFVTGRFIESAGSRPAAARAVLFTIGLVVVAGLIASNNFSPFIYFRF